ACAPGKVSRALASTLDFLPTVASVTGVQLPGDRHYDGMDLMPVLAGHATEAHHELFHPNSGDGCGILGELDAMRYGKYKVFWKTGSNQSLACQGNYSKCLRHDPPLVFDVEADPGEAVPLTETAAPELPEVLRNAIAARESKLRDISTSLVSVADYSSGHVGFDSTCCNANHAMCACEDLEDSENRFEEKLKEEEEEVKREIDKHPMLLITLSIRIDYSITES
ncbi:hypothetical protein CYMTET_52196, partial [Cymbomonas tetramitiformis]